MAAWPGVRGQLRSVHCWFFPLPQLYSWILVPFAVLALTASRHSPDCTPLIVPLELRFHCWLVPPLQSQMMMAVPLVVPLPDASRHLFPYTISCLLDV